MDDIKTIAVEVLGTTNAKVFLETFHRVFGSNIRPVLPNAGERVAVASGCQKTAALCYDRVWTGYRDDAPSDVRFYADTQLERRMLLLGLLRVLVQEHHENDVDVKHRLYDAITKYIVPMATPVPADAAFARMLADAISSSHQIDVTPIYNAASDRDKCYREGDRSVVIATLANLNIVDEDALEWSQVDQFRQDKRARHRLRKLMHWLDASFIGKSRSYIEDEIAIRLEQYHEALRSHGIRTIIGSLAATLDSKVLLAGSAAVTAAAYVKDPVTAGLVGASIVIGKVSLHVAQSLLDLSVARHAAYPEVSFVAEVETLSKARPA